MIAIGACAGVVYFKILLLAAANGVIIERGNGFLENSYFFVIDNSLLVYVC